MTAKKRHALITTIRREVLQAVAEAIGPRAAYFPPVRSADYLGISLRKFDDGPAKEIPCIRLTPRGKRLFKKSDLDAFMARYRHEPTSEAQVDRLVDDVVGDFERSQKRHQQRRTTA
jgi:hypothetical protein